MNTDTPQALLAELARIYVVRFVPGFFIAPRKFTQKNRRQSTGNTESHIVFYAAECLLFTTAYCCS